MSDMRGVLLDRMIEELRDLRRRVAALETGEYVANAGLLQGLAPDDSGAADAHIVATDADGGAKVVDLTATGGANVGTAIGAGAGQMFIARDGASPFVVTLASSTAVVAPAYEARRSRGTIASPSAISSGDVLLGLFGAGYQTDQWSGNVAAIRILAAQNFTNTAAGTRIDFATTALDAASRTVRMQIEPSGRVLIGTSTDDGTNRLQVAGGIAATGVIGTTNSLFVGADDAVFFGETDVDGRWRIIRSGNDLVIQRRESSSWVTKSTISA